ncbi:hypothetical protein HaLaN_15083 [Haematococcus lacustris]|uniref:Uncharacterized protein n=1 Tax=Haematococcus lacustris TaxID=44745 RepID=A0A699ZHR0_HAELA|nr:hypothetical protein HaLaN_15083 [Haematococcus lacustris]
MHEVSSNTGCELIIVEATASVPNAHFSSAILLSGTWPWADCTASNVQRGIIEPAHVSFFMNRL